MRLLHESTPPRPPAVRLRSDLGARLVRRIRGPEPAATASLVSCVPVLGVRSTPDPRTGSTRTRSHLTARVRLPILLRSCTGRRPAPRLESGHSKAHESPRRRCGRPVPGDIDQAPTGDTRTRRRGESRRRVSCFQGPTRPGARTMRKRIEVGCWGHGDGGPAVHQPARGAPLVRAHWLAASERSRESATRTRRPGGSRRPSRRGSPTAPSSRDTRRRPRLVFSALDANVAGELERAFADAGTCVSNARNHRMDPTVPLLVPEVNADHLPS